MSDQGKMLMFFSIQLIFLDKQTKNVGGQK